MLHNSKLRLLTGALICCIFITSLTFAEISDEEGLRQRRERQPEKNITQKIIAVPTVIARFPLFITGKGIKYTATYIDRHALIPRTKAILTSDDGLIALYPTASWGGRSGLGGELNFFNKRFLKKGNRLSLQASYSANGHQNHYVRYRMPEAIGPLSFDMRGGYKVNTNEDFFGIGDESDRDDRTNFLHEEIGGELTVRAALTKWLRTEALVDYTDHSIGGGDETYDSTLDKFDAETTPGLDGAALLAVGGAIALDTRDNEFYPSRGQLIQFAATMFDQADDSKYGFMRYTMELSNHLTLFRPGRIFAVRLLGEINTRLSDNKDTPFFERASLGGPTDLRGYSTGRFRDKDLIMLNIEYRYSIWEAYRDTRGAVDAVIFMDIGRVFDNLWEDTFSDYKTSYGGGIRARTTQDFLLRAEVAWSEEETNVILRFEPMF